MTDRELLELAGMAAGEVYGPDRNPLERDDLALRLAVSLGLSIEVHTDQTQPFPWLRVVDRAGNWTHAGPGGEYLSDPHAAARRAIVCAAAAMAEEAQRAKMTDIWSPPDPNGLFVVKNEPWLA